MRLTIAPEMGEGEVSSLLVAFVRRHPKVRIELVVTNRRVNLIDESVDLALRAGPLDDSTLVARRIAVAELGLFAAPAYLASRGTPRRLADVAKHDCVLHRTARGVLPWRLQGPRGLERVSMDGPITADDLGTVRLLTLAGLGIALMPNVVVLADVTAGRLVRVLPAYALRGTALSMVSPPLRHVPARVTLLRDFLVRELSARVAGTPCALDASASPPPSRPHARRNTSDRLFAGIVTTSGGSEARRTSRGRSRRRDRARPSADPRRAGARRSAGCSRRCGGRRA